VESFSGNGDLNDAETNRKYEAKNKKNIANSVHPK